MLFMVGIDHSCMPGADIERTLCQTWDIADFQVVGVRHIGRLLRCVPSTIKIRAEMLARHIFQHEERAEFYVGVARGYEVRTDPTAPQGARTRCVCYDQVVVLNCHGAVVLSQCLNKQPAHWPSVFKGRCEPDTETTFSSLRNAIDLINFRLHAST